MKWQLSVLLTFHYIMYFSFLFVLALLPLFIVSDFFFNFVHLEIGLLHIILNRIIFQLFLVHLLIRVQCPENLFSIT